MAKERAERIQQAEALEQMGMLALEIGKHTDAAERYQAALAIREELDDQRGVAFCLHALGNIAYDQADYAAARERYQAGLTIAHQLNDPLGTASALVQLGRVDGLQAQFKPALGHFLDALAVLTALQSPHMELVRTEMGSLRAAVGEEQFRAWLAELAGPDQGQAILASLSPEPASASESRAAASPASPANSAGAGDQEFVQAMSGIAEIAVNARTQGTAQEQEIVAAQLAEYERESRERTPEMADLFAVLRALLLGEDATPGIDRLPDPLKQIAVNTRERLSS